MKVYWVRRVDGGPGGTDMPRGALGHVFVALDRPPIGDEREYVKREAQRILAGDKDRYLVEPLTPYDEPVSLVVRT